MKKKIAVPKEKRRRPDGQNQLHSKQHFRTALNREVEEMKEECDRKRKRSTEAAS